LSKQEKWTRRYDLPGIGRFGEGGAIILLTSDGMLAAVSDFDNYAFRWSHFGDGDFRKFVVGMAKSPDYIMSKLGDVKYDGIKTRLEIKRRILEYRRRRDVTRQWAREEFDLWDDSDFETEWDFWNWSNRTRLDCIDIAKASYPRMLVRFVNETIVQRLCPLLVAELESEGNP
jgi:hypothetical protein